MAIIAKLKNGQFTQNEVNVVNNGNTSGDYFYLSGNNELSFCNPYHEISIERQKENLLWFVGKFREAELIEQI